MTHEIRNQADPVRDPKTEEIEQYGPPQNPLLRTPEPRAADAAEPSSRSDAQR
jgi:hypothetical protein